MADDSIIILDDLPTITKSTETIEIVDLSSSPQTRPIPKYTNNNFKQCNENKKRKISDDLNKVDFESSRKITGHRPAVRNDYNTFLQKSKSMIEGRTMETGVSIRSSTYQQHKVLDFTQMDEDDADFTLSSDIFSSSAPQLDLYKRNINTNANANTNTNTNTNSNTNKILDKINDIHTEISKTSSVIIDDDSDTDTDNFDILSVLGKYRSTSSKGKTQTQTETETRTQPQTQSNIISSSSFIIETDDDATDFVSKPKMCEKEKTNINDESKENDNAPKKSRRKKRTSEEITQDKLIKEQRKKLEQFNKSSFRKEDFVKYMIIEFDDELKDSMIVRNVKSQLEPLDVEIKFKQYNVDKYKDQKINIIKWYRKVLCVFDPEDDLFKPIRPKIELEEKVGIHIAADIFIGMVSNGELEQNFESIIKDLAETNTIILFIEGFFRTIQRIQTSNNRSYTNQVRQLIDNDENVDNNNTGTSSNKANRRKKASNNNTSNFITVDDIEKVLSVLQIKFNCRVFPTSSEPDTGEWLVNMTKTLSIAPFIDKYKGNDELSHLGVIKPGKDAFDMYVITLEQARMVTPGVSRGIANNYGSLQQLYKAFKSNGHGILEGIPIGKINSNIPSKRRIGPAISKSLHTLFTCEDPNAFVKI